MTSAKQFCILVAITFSVLSSTGFVYGQLGPGDFFWSDDDLGQGAVNGDLEFTVNVGESHSLFLYWSTNGPADADLDLGAGLDIDTSQSGIIAFDLAETLNFEVTAADTPISLRWTDLDGNGGFAGPARVVTSDSIENLLALRTVGGPGIVEFNTGPVFLDHGYDADADAFQFAQVDFTALNVGTVDLLTVAGAAGIVHSNEPVPATILGATINVVNIPEPSSTIMILAACVPLALRRKRNHF